MAMNMTNNSNENPMSCSSKMTMSETTHATAIGPRGRRSGMRRLPTRRVESESISRFSTK